MKNNYFTPGNRIDRKSIFAFSFVYLHFIISYRIHTAAPYPFTCKCVTTHLCTHNTILLFNLQGVANISCEISTQSEIDGQTTTAMDGSYSTCDAYLLRNMDSFGNTDS